MNGSLRILVPYVGELHISDLMFVVVISPTLFYCMHTSKKRKATSPTFY